MSKKQQIYKVALELFVREGFNGTPTALIAKNASVANGTLFHYFPTKDILINSLYMEIKDNFLLNITDNYNPELGFPERLKILWKSIIYWGLNNPLDFLFIQQYTNSPYINHLSEEKRSSHERFFRLFFEEGKISGTLRDMPIDLLFQTFISLANGIIEFLKINADKSNHEHTIELAFKCLWNGISKSAE